MNKILIIKTSALGDIVHAFPVIDYLRGKFPSTQIDWVVEAPFADLVKAHPKVNNVLAIATKSWRKQWHKLETLGSLSNFRKLLRKESYDAAFDLQGNIKSGLILSQVRCKNKIGFGKTSVPEWPNLLFTRHRVNPPADRNIRHDYLALVSSYFNDQDPSGKGTVNLNIPAEDVAKLGILIAECRKPSRPIVAVCPGSAWKNKQMAPETLKAFLLLIADYLNCCFLFVWGTSEERLQAEQLRKEFQGRSLLVEKMGLPALQNLMGMCDLVIAMDSLPLHLAGTTKTPTFSIFGASSALKYKPLGSSHYAYQGNCPYGRTFVKRCPILRTCPTGACIRDLKAEEVFKEFKSWREQNQLFRLSQCSG